MADKPIHTIKLGRVRAAVWRNETQAGTRPSVTLSRSYRDESGSWKDSASFWRDDLLALAKVAEQTYLWLADRQQQGELAEEEPAEAGE
jgi:hypothetical protein